MLEFDTVDTQPSVRQATAKYQYEHVAPIKFPPTAQLSSTDSPDIELLWPWLFANQQKLFSDSLFYVGCTEA